MFSSLYNCPYFLSCPSVNDLFSPLLGFLFLFHLLFPLYFELSCISHLNFLFIQCFVVPLNLRSVMLFFNPSRVVETKLNHLCF